jgi:hypothetical protein
MYWKLRYWWACVSGSILRALGLSFRNGRTVSEIMYELEQDPVMRELLKRARDRH